MTLRRRVFLKQAGMLAASGAYAAACGLPARASSDDVETPYYARPTGRINFDDFRPVKDGMSDNSAQLTAALRAAEGKTLLIDSGDIYFSGSLDIPGNTTVVLGQSATLLTSNAVPVRAHGSAAERTIPLRADARKGDTALRIADPASFSVGDYVVVSDDFRTAYNRSQQGQMARILAVSGSSLELDNVLWSDYLVDRNAKLRKIDRMLKDVRIEGAGRIVGAKNARNPADQYAAVETLYVDGFEFSGITVSQFTRRGLRIRSTLNGSARDNRFEDIVDRDEEKEKATLGYAVLVSEASQWFHAENNSAYRCGKIYDVGENDDGVEGISRFLLFKDSYHYDAVRQGAGTHAGAEYVTLEGLRIWMKQGIFGIYTRSANTTIRNCEIICGGNVSRGIYCDSNGQAGDIEISGNKIEGPTKVGISVECRESENRKSGLEGTFDRVTVSNNTVSPGSNRGIDIRTMFGERWSKRRPPLPLAILNGNVSTGKAVGCRVFAGGGDVELVQMSGGYYEATEDKGDGVQISAASDADAVVVRAQMANIYAKGRRYGFNVHSRATVAKCVGCDGEGPEGQFRKLANIEP